MINIESVKNCFGSVILSLDEFAAYVENINSLGIEDVLELKQAAYDRYLKVIEESK